MPAPEDTPLLPAASDQKDTFKGYVTIFVGCVILVGLSFLCYELAEQGYLVDILDKINEYPTSQKFAVYFLVLYVPGAAAPHRAASLVLPPLDRGRASNHRR